jgi:hypothetical protein
MTMTTENNAEQGRMSGLEGGANPAESLQIFPDSHGQSYPQHYPHQDDALGEPLSIQEAARLMGCSDWTIRHRHMPQGLPHFRSGPAGKLVFYRNQVVRWILQQQKKGGNTHVAR